MNACIAAIQLHLAFLNGRCHQACIDKGSQYGFTHKSDQKYDCHCVKVEPIEQILKNPRIKINPIMDHGIDEPAPGPYLPFINNY